MLKGQMQDNENDGPGTVVGVNVALTGTLKDQNDIAVYGMVDGEVVSDKTITIGQSAQVKGPVKGKVITVSGVIRGSIDASEKLEILETGKIFGSITAGDLVVRSGAQISGKVIMGMDDKDTSDNGDEDTKEDAEDNSDESSSEDEIEEEILKPDKE